MPSAQVKEVELVERNQVKSFHQDIEGIPHVSKQNKTNKQKKTRTIFKRLGPVCPASK